MIVRPRGSVAPHALIDVIGEAQAKSLVVTSESADPVGVGSITFTVLVTGVAGLPAASVFE